jgi:hypothetical protein
MTTKTKPKPTEFFICIESFAGNEFAVAEGDLLPGDDERVLRCPDRFVVVGTPDEEIRRLKIAAALPPPLPEPLGRVKLRVLPGPGGLSALNGGRPQTVFANGREYVSGETLEAEGANAEHLIDVGACEVVGHLRRKKKAPGRVVGGGWDREPLRKRSPRQSLFPSPI